ncbi:MAG: glycosyltransferase [Candidatus Sumerlaeota bacterium]|nr:glycosyltransferase [Candidatus Sumerlaeota bacterium]
MEEGVSIVVPVYQGERCILECIDSLLRLDYPVSRMEIIVVDNNSTDRTAERIRSRPVRYVLEAKQGACRARNAGWRRAAFGLVAFTDADCVADPQWLRELVKHFDDPRVGGCGGRLAPMPPTTIVEQYVIYKDILSQERALRPNPLSPPFLITANVMYRKSVLEQLGGFDEVFTVNGEDADLAWRAQWQDWRIVFEPAAVVHHKHRSTLNGFLRQVRSYGAGTSYLFWKHRRRLGFRTRIVLQPYQELLSSLFCIPFRLIFSRDTFHRFLSVLDFLGALNFLIGKISASRRLGIRFY